MSRAIIDVDSFLYRASLTCKELVEIQEGIFYEVYNLNTALSYLTKLGQELAQRVNCNEYVMVTGGVGKNFRYFINPDYKGNRKKVAKPIMLDKVREQAFKKLPIVYTPNLEADDTCRILFEDDKNNVIVSIDKDLATFSSRLYNPDTDKVRFISVEQAQSNFKRQLLTGDKCDGYNGLPGIGPATADKLILGGITIDDIAQLYVEKGLGIEEFEKVYNCAKIVGKENYSNGVITLYGGKKLDTREFANQQ
jgi:DNA polymerase-1